MAERRVLKRLRPLVQIAWTALSNGYLAGFAGGKIYSGPLKGVCVPGLNCYSCPGALGACPVGSLQAMLTGTEPRLPLYVAGFLLSFGATLGRGVCGWLCPFGLAQDALHALAPRGRGRDLPLPFDRALRRLKYAVLALLVVALPLFARDPPLNVSDPWFCKYLCPSGTLMAGLPLLAANESLRDAAGALFAWKCALLALILGLSALTYRPFCKYLCPLGALYGPFNRVALFRLRVVHGACSGCGACARACPMGVELPRLPGSAECVRCGACVRACPSRAISLTFSGARPRAAKSGKQETRSGQR